MTIDATFWVMISFFLFIGLLIYFQIPQKIRATLEENILSIKNQIDIIIFQVQIMNDYLICKRF